MIYDCFHFNGELDLLDIRLRHHSFVDKFIIIESTRTYTGKQKPLFYYENAKRYTDFHSKIHHIVLDFPFNSNKNWQYEHLQRNIIRGFTFNEEDWILYSDCDELIRQEILQKINGSSDIWHLRMDLFFYYFNLKLKESINNESYHLNSCFKNKFHMAKIIKPNVLFDFKNIYEIRQYQINDPDKRIMIDNAGWHFSNLGPPDRIYNKFTSFSHWGDPMFKNISIESIKRNKKEHKDPLGRPVTYEIINDSALPDYIQENKEKLKNTPL